MRGAGRRSRPHQHDRDLHQPPHPLRDRDRRPRPAEDGPAGQSRDARPLDHVHLRRGARGRRLAPRGVLHARASLPSEHGFPVAQGFHPRGPRVDAIATTRPTRSSGRSVAGSSSPSTTAEWSRTSWPWPTPTPWAQGRSAARSTWRSSAPWLPAWSRTTNSSVSPCCASTLDPRAALDELFPRVAPDYLDGLEAVEGLW